MATKKKAAPRSAKKPSAARAAAPAAARVQATPKVQGLVFVFTVLSVVFAVMAFWRYS
ncbi:MAG TPA: hypothetical protein VF466_02845 [Candidatus Saccharimonadales bacterium]